MTNRTETGTSDNPDVTFIRGTFDLSDPVGLRAKMARAGLNPLQLRTYDDLEHGWVDPLDDDEMRTIVRRFMSSLWRACERAEWHAAEAATLASDISSREADDD